MVKTFYFYYTKQVKITLSNRMEMHVLKGDAVNAWGTLTWGLCSEEWCHCQDRSPVEACNVSCKVSCYGVGTSA